MTNNKNVLFTTGNVRCFFSHLSPSNLPRELYDSRGIASVADFLPLPGP